MSMHIPKNVDELNEALQRCGVWRRVAETLEQGQTFTYTGLQCWPVGVLEDGITSSEVNLLVVAHFLRHNARRPISNGQSYWQTVTFRVEEKWPFGGIGSLPLSATQIVVVERTAQKAKFD